MVVKWLFLRSYVCFSCISPAKLVSCHMTNPTKWPVRPAKTQISLGICPVWSESLLCAWRNTGPLTTCWAHSKDSDQTGWCPSWSESFAGYTSFCWFNHATALVVFNSHKEALLFSVYWWESSCKLPLRFLFLQNSGVHIRSEFMYDMKDVWSKIQAVVRY